jgi:hypothetical protein
VTTGEPFNASGALIAMLKQMHSVRLAPLHRTFAASCLSATTILVACGGSVEVFSDKNADLESVAPRVLGSACVPERELDPKFLGFSEREVITEEPFSAGDDGRQLICLVRGFRGRVTCPYGQDRDGKPPVLGNTTWSACQVPGQIPVVGAGTGAACVPAQCPDRPAASAVYLSCRCANPAGRTDDGATYCGAQFECAQVIPSLPNNEKLSGAYCVKKGAQANPPPACAGAPNACAL